MVVTAFMILLALVVVKTFIWLFGLVPFVKRHAGGRSHCWLWKTAMLNDYLLAREIVKKEAIKKPISVFLWEIVSVLQIVCLTMLLWIILNKP